MAAAPPKVSIKALKERCKVLERHVRRRELATEEELRDYRPGGAQNHTPRSMWAWIHWYANLVRFSGREDLLPTRGGSAEAADSLVLQALRNTPEVVTLTPAPDGKARQVQVHPKSMDALLHLQARDDLVGWLMQRYHWLKAQNSAKDLEMLDRIMAEASVQYRAMVWVVCSPGPGLPFDPADTDTLTPPAWADLNPVEVLVVLRTHLQVNGHRLQALEALVSPYADKGKDGRVRRPTWSGFFGTLAVQMHTNPERLMKDHSLAELLAMVKLNADAQREAMGDKGDTDAEGFSNDDRTHLGNATQSTTYRRKLAQAPGGSK